MNKGSMKKPLVCKVKRPTMFGSRVIYGIVMWGIFAFSVKICYMLWPQITNFVSALYQVAPTFAGLVSLGIAGYFLSLLIGIFGMFWRPGDKDNNPDTVDHSTEIPPSGAPAHALREKGYITPDILNPFSFFYLYKKVVDIVQPDNRLMHQERWMWAWIRGLKNIADVPRDPTPAEVTDMKRGGVYNCPANTEDFEKRLASFKQELIQEIIAHKEQDHDESVSVDLSTSIRDLARSVDGLKSTTQHLRRAIVEKKKK